MTTSQPKRSCNSLTEALASVSYRPAQRYGQPPKPPTSVSPLRSAPHLQRPAGWDGHAPRSLSQQLDGRLHGLRLHSRHGYPPKAPKAESDGMKRLVREPCCLQLLQDPVPCVGSRRPANFNSPPGTAPTRCTGPSSWPAAPRRSPAPWWRHFAGLCVRCERGCSGACDERAERWPMRWLMRQAEVASARLQQGSHEN